MTKASHLEKAIEYIARKIDLETFEKGLKDWEGSTELKIGSYHCLISKCAKEEILKAIEVEKRMINNTLEFYDIEMDI